MKALSGYNIVFYSIGSSKENNFTRFIALINASPNIASLYL